VQAEAHHNYFITANRTRQRSYALGALGPKPCGLKI